MAACCAACCLSAQEVDDIFYKYGSIKRISIKPGEAGGMPAFCFVEFGHSDEAYDAVKGMDGREKFGKRLRVSESMQLRGMDTLQTCILGATLQKHHAAPACPSASATNSLHERFLAGPTRSEGAC